jgi:hypothetical protein
MAHRRLVAALAVLGGLALPLGGCAGEGASAAPEGRLAMTEPPGRNRTRACFRLREAAAPVSS